MQGHIIGTAEYMSPEQASGGQESAIDGRSDLYSLGLVLYEMLTGSHPFQADTPIAVLNHQLYKVPAPPDSLAAVPAAMSALVLKMLQKDPKDRFQSAAEALAALRDPPRWYAAAPSVTVAESPLPNARPAAPTVAEPWPVESVTRLRDGKSTAKVRLIGVRRLKSALTLIGAVAVLVFIGWLVKHRKSHQKTEGSTWVGAKPPQEDAATLRSRVKNLLDTNRYTEALQLARAACDKGNAAGCAILGRMYGNGEGGVEENPQFALEYSRKGCEGGDANGCSNLGMLSPDAAQAVEFFRKGCDGGSALGCEKLGYEYFFGKVVTKDLPRAAELWRKGCDLGDAYSCTGLGSLYEEGKGVAKNIPEAAELYRQACDGGINTIACSGLGLLYEKGGAGFEKDGAQAAASYRKGCESGSGVGCTHLAYLYEEGGTGLAKDATQAVIFFRKGCEARDEDGCTRLGFMYDAGTQVKPNAAQAVSFYRKGCDGGSAGGCGNLAVLYENGTKITKNIPEAVRLYRKGCNGGYKLACKDLKRLGK